jgi:hypothetical protein
MATTLSLVEKGWENWSPEDWERYYWDDRNENQLV